MKYEKPIAGLIRVRRSWRSYREELIPDDAKERIRTFISGLQDPPFGSKVRFVIAESDTSKGKKPQGTYGVVKGASCFLVGILTPSEMGFEDFGYLFEAVVLYITSQGLGTCWMGGTFNSSLFSGMARLREDEIIPVVSPLGIIADRRTLVDTAFVLFAGSKQRKLWTEIFFQNTFGNSLKTETAGSYAQALEMVRLAPSASNRQPWRVVMRDGCFHFYLMRTRGYSTFNRAADLQRIDMGIAMFHFEQTVRESGMTGKWEKRNPGITELPERTTYVISWTA
jgi:hypothetical protein